MKTEAWNWWARNDPLYRMCSDRSKRGNKWDINEFFNTGEVEVQRVLDYLNSIGLTANQIGEMLDFGCGVGRLTRAFAKYFNQCYGVDISPGMVEKANELNQGIHNITFDVMDINDLDRLEADKFSFIYSSLVLQHIEPSLQERYLKSLVRLLKPSGIFVFQLADSYRPPKNISIYDRVAEFRKRLQPRARISSILKPLGIHLSQREPGVEMFGVEESMVKENIYRAGGIIMDIRLTNSTDSNFNGDLRFQESEPVTGWVSKQYTVTKLEY